MEEQGIVVQNKKNTVLIKAHRTSACDSCASKKACHTAGSNDSEILIEADNPIGANVGDRVVFTVGAASILKAGLLLYLLPVIMFIAGVVLGQILGESLFPDQNRDLVAGITGVVFLAAAFGGLQIYSRIADKTKSLRPRVLRVE